MRTPHGHCMHSSWTFCGSSSICRAQQNCSHTKLTPFSRIFNALQATDMYFACLRGPVPSIKVGRLNIQGSPSLMDWLCLLLTSFSVFVALRQHQPLLSQSCLVHSHRPLSCCHCRSSSRCLLLLETTIASRAQ